MDVSSMLSANAQEATEAADTKRLNHQYPTRHAASTQDPNTFVRPPYSHMPQPLRANGAAAAGSGYDRVSPVKKNQKHVSFLLIDNDHPHIQARLPMRVMISTTDTTDGIITTVKNFYGLYEYGVSFEDVNGISLIATYDNFEHNMTVYVRTVAQKSLFQGEQVRDPASPKRPTLGAPFEMRPSPYNGPQSPGSRSAGVRSMSPQSDIGHRSASAALGGKPRPQRTKSKDNSLYGDGDGYSSGDNGGGSVASSRRSKAEVVNPEISTDNIVEGGRRKMAFQSSELPLFVPPQVPMSTSISSISPQRRAGPPSAISPYPLTNQRTFSYTQPLPSPQSYGSSTNYNQYAMNINGYNGAYNLPTKNPRGLPNYATYPQAKQHGSGILPTPDPTVGSAISDEDAALQLMRLNKPTAFSHGRTSTSTADDAMSGKADAASSEEESSGEDDDESGLPMAPHYSRGDFGPQRKKQRVMNELPSEGTSEEYEDDRDGTFGGDRKLHKAKGFKHRNSMPGSLSKGGKPRANSTAKPKSKSCGNPKTPASPLSMPAPSRKGSTGSLISFQHPFGADEDDLSSKPRCQRCRKSKKGCDRQRPCGRCKDAGIGIEGCVSEDEGNGRKGRYGRHMGVSVKKAEEVFAGDEPGQYDAAQSTGGGPANGFFVAPTLPDKSKKRKR